MKFVYDPEVDILMIHLRPYEPGEHSARSPEVMRGVVIDQDAEGNPIEIEIQGASRKFPQEDLAAYDVRRAWITLAEAASRAGLSPNTFKNQAQAGRLKAEKHGRDWMTTEAWLREYLADRKYNAKASAG